MPLKGYGQFCPVSKAAEVLTERWTPLVVRELLCGSHRFNELRRGVPLMSPALLAERLRQLEASGVVERRRTPNDRYWEYHLTQAGEELREVIEGLGAWGQRWIRTPEGETDLDVSLLMWDMRRRLNLDAFPPERVVVEFEFVDAPRAKSRWWLVLHDEVDLCFIFPGFEVDLRVATDVETMTRVWMGDLPFGTAVRSGDLRLRGPAQLQRALPRWLELSVFADVPRPGHRGRRRRGARADEDGSAA